MSTEQQPVKISVALLAEQVESGMKRKELAEFYGLSEAQMAKALKQAGLRIRSFRRPVFSLLYETEIETESSVNEDTLQQDSEIEPIPVEVEAELLGY